MTPASAPLHVSQQSAGACGSLRIATIETAEYCLTLDLGKGGLECRVSLACREGADSLTTDTLRAVLADHGVSHGIDTAALEAFCTAVGLGSQQTSAIVARGDPPLRGADGTVEIFVKAASATADYDEDATGTIDFRHPHYFANVDAGEQIGVVHPPTRGAPGRTVTGIPLPAEDGDPARVQQTEGVSVAADGRIFAERSGRVIHQDGAISVSDELLIEGNVDFEVGSIDFKGCVLVQGDVLDDFGVSADKVIVVTGTVGNCIISSGSDLQIGGMAGQGKGRIVCKGNLSARYLDSVEVFCDGDITVETEILNCSVRCGGIVSVGGGHISGGECIALGGIEAGTAGSRAGIPTKLLAGADYRDLDELAALFGKMKELAAQLERTSDRDTYATLFEEKQKILREIAAVRGRRHPSANARINIRGRILDNVSITLDGITEIQTERSGPLSLIANPAEGTLAPLSLTPLDVPAAELAARFQETRIA